MKRSVSAPVLFILLVAGCATAPSPGVDKKIRSEDEDAMKAVGAKANGLIVWSSARSGSPDLYTMKTDGSDVKAITQGDFVDWNPRFSPDGTKILFCRSKDESFVRERDANVAALWDLYTIKPDGTELTKVVEDAAWGSWITADEILYVRGSAVLRSKLDGAEEHKVLDGTRHAVFAGATLMQPELSRDGHLIAMSLGGGRRQVGLWDIKRRTWTQTGSGAQVSWSPDGGSIYWSNPTGNGLSSIARLPIEGGKPAKDISADQLRLIDLPGKRSREAFPRRSPDGKWLVWGASIKGLEDDLEDFEIYLWEIGTLPENAVRLTFNSANDSWPDIFTGGGPAPAAKAGEEEDEANGAEDETAPKDAAKPSKPEGEADDAAEKPADKAAEKAATVPDEGTADEETPSPNKPKAKAKPAKGKGKKKRR